MASGDASQPEIGKFVDAAGIKTNYHDMGTGDPLVLIHGSGPGVTAWANWRANMPVLAKSFRVLAPDMLGFGYTEFPADPIRDKARWVEHLLGFLDALGLEKVDLVGNSFGGGLALAFTIAHPERVKRAILMGAAGLEFEITEALDYVWGYQPSFESMKKVVGYLATDLSRITDDLIQSRYEASIRPGVFEAYSALFGETPRQKHIEMLASKEEDVRRVETEILLLHGRDDTVLPADLSVRLNALLPNSDAHIFGRCGHWVQIERADSFNRLVTTFFKEGLKG